MAQTIARQSSFSPVLVDRKTTTDLPQPNLLTGPVHYLAVRQTSSSPQWCSRWSPYSHDPRPKSAILSSSSDHSSDCDKASTFEKPYTHSSPDSQNHTATLTWLKAAPSCKSVDVTRNSTNHLQANDGGEHNSNSSMSTLRSIYLPSVPELESDQGMSTYDYASATGSEAGSHDTAQMHSDSGYAPSTVSLPSMDHIKYESYDGGIQTNYAGTWANEVGSHHSHHHLQRGIVHRRNRASNSSEVNGQVAHIEESPRYQCSYCPKTLRCPSDLKKHVLKHEKPFRCDVQGCAWSKGFTTINDLNRHKKSRHKIGSSTKSFRCASENCKNKQKIWPRLDNFKQHVTRMHPQENRDDLIRRSEYAGRLDAFSSSSPPTRSSVEMPMASMGESKAPYQAPLNYTCPPSTAPRYWPMPTTSGSSFEYETQTTPASYTSWPHQYTEHSSTVGSDSRASVLNHFR